MAFRWNTARLNFVLREANGPAGRNLVRKAIAVESLAKRLCPVDTGNLRSSITWELGSDGQGLYADIGTNVEYAGYVEFGTRFMAAQPYLVPALAAAR